MLERLFGSESRAKIIKFFCTKKQDKYYMRELARGLDIKLNALSRELDNLEDMGFLTSHVEDNKKYFSVNNSFPLLGELSSLIYKSVVLLEKAVIDDLRELSGLQVFILTGIFVKQDTGTDILLVGNIDKRKVQRLISALSDSFYQDIRFTLFKASEFKYRMEVTDKFVNKILNLSPIVILNKYSQKTQ